MNMQFLSFAVSTAGQLKSPMNRRSRRAQVLLPVKERQKDLDKDKMGGWLPLLPLTRRKSDPFH